MIINESDMPEIRRRHADARIVLAGGTFDLLHPGHVDYLRACKARGDILVVGISSDEEVRSRKGTDRPMLNEVDRARLIDSFKYPDYTVVRSFAPTWAVSTVQAVALLHPDVVVVGPPASPDSIAYLRAQLPDVEIAVDEQPKVNSSSDVMRRVKETYHGH
jgi:cytidyltransferase-like protein